MQFLIFKSCVDYAGKATNARSDMHFLNAKKVALGLKSSEDFGDNIAAINECWGNGSGVMCLPFETNATSHEALCREAAVIACLGLDNIKNRVSGSLHGEMKSWDFIKLKNFGELTLFAVFKKFIVKRPPVIRAGDMPLRVGSKRCSRTVMCEFCGNTLK